MIVRDLITALKQIDDSLELEDDYQVVLRIDPERDYPTVKIEEVY